MNLILVGIIVVLGLIIIGGGVFWLNHRRKIKWNFFLSEQQNYFQAYKDDGFKELNGSLQAEVSSMRQQLFEILNGYVAQMAGKIDNFNHQVEVRFGEINHQVGQRLTQGYEKNQDLFGEVIKRLALIDQAQSHLVNLGGEIQNLQGILNDKKARGSFGETQLNLLLQEVLPESEYQLQHKLSNGCRVDCLLKLPNAVGNIAIDSKFPLENYRKKFDLTFSESERSIFEAQFKSDVKKHIQDIADKYIIPGETAEGAIMFLPAEGVFADIHSNAMELVNFSYQKKVWLVSPSTLMALLLTISSILKEVKTHERGKEIQEKLLVLAKEFSRFKERLTNLDKHFRMFDEDLHNLHHTANKIIKSFQQVTNIHESDNEESI